MNVMNTFGIEHAMPGKNVYFDTVTAGTCVQVNVCLKVHRKAEE
jgi:hypothetical protein